VRGYGRTYLPVLVLTCFLFGAVSLPSRAQVAGFGQIPGSLSQISVGADGAVWGVDSSQNIFTYDPIAGQFTQLPGALVQIALGNANTVWGINAQNLIFHWDPANQLWTYIPGALQKIAVGSDGDVWGINTQSQVWHYDQQQQTWQYVPETLSDIAVGSAGAVYGLGPLSDNQSSYWYNPGAGQFQATSVQPFCPGNFVGILQLNQISVGVDGDAWAAGAGFSCNGQNVAYHYHRLQFSWDWTPSHLYPAIMVQVAVGYGDSVWSIDSNGFVYQYDGQTSNWVQIPGALRQIAAGGDGSVWGLDERQRIFYYTGLPRPYQTLIPVPGSFKQISVAPDGDAWAVDAANLVYNFDATSQSWQNIPGQLMQIADGGGKNPPNSSSNIWGVNPSGQIWQWGMPYISPLSWSYVPGELAQLSVASDGTVWGINAQQQIYRFDPASQSWVNVPGSLVQISVGSATDIWGVNYVGQVYTWDFAKGWANVPGSLQQVKAAFDGAVWGVDAAGGLYQWNSNSGSQAST
jgi:virginiamycin B lyase